MKLNTVPGKIKDFAETGLFTGKKAFELQTRYMEAFFKSNTAIVAELTDARISSLQETATAKTFSEFYESNVAFEETFREKMKSLYQENSQLMSDYQKEVKELIPFDKDFFNGIRETAEDTFASARKAVESAMPSSKTPAKKPAPKKAASSTAAAS